MHKKNTITDFSAVVTGLLLALNMPASIPLWMPVLGSAFAIIVVKQLFGGLGQNFMNPALAGRCFLMISFAGKMTDFAVSDSFRGVVDTVSGATPLAALKQNGFTDSSVSVLHMFIGDIQGTIGETSALAILIGAAILLVFKVIDLKIPLTYIGSFAVFVILYMLGTGKGFDVNYLFSHIFGGGLMLGAWFIGYRLCHNTDHTKRTVCIRCLSWCTDCGLPSLRRFRRGRILCDHFLQPVSSDD